MSNVDHIAAITASGLFRAMVIEVCIYIKSEDVLNLFQWYLKLLYSKIKMKGGSGANQAHLFKIPASLIQKSGGRQLLLVKGQNDAAQV